MARILKALLLIALTAVLVVGLTTTACCNSNGNEPNGYVPSGNNPDNLDLSGPGYIIECEDTSAENTEVGDSLPDFTFQDASGQLFSLSDFEGKQVMLNFWRISCHWCAVEMPYIQQVYDQWPDENVVILTINVADSAEAVAGFFQENGLSLPVILDTEAELATRYLVNSYPLSFFIDEEGAFQGVWPGALQSAQELEDILNWLISL